MYHFTEEKSDNVLTHYKVAVNVIYIGVTKLQIHDKPNVHTCDKTTYT